MFALLLLLLELHCYCLLRAAFVVCSLQDLHLFWYDGVSLPGCSACMAQHDTLPSSCCHALHDTSGTEVDGSALSMRGCLGGDCCVQQKSPQVCGVRSAKHRHDAMQH